MRASVTGRWSTAYLPEAWQWPTNEVPLPPSKRFSQLHSLWQRLLLSQEEVARLHPYLHAEWVSWESMQYLCRHWDRRWRSRRGRAIVARRWVVPWLLQRPRLFRFGRLLRLMLNGVQSEIELRHRLHLGSLPQVCPDRLGRQGPAWHHKQVQSWGRQAY